VPLLAQRSERGAKLFAEDPRLLPSREVAASVDPVVVDEVVRVRALGPAPRSLVELVGEHGDGERDRDVLGVEEVRLVLPIQASRGDAGVGQPVERDVVEEIVAREVAVVGAVEDALDKAGLAGPVTVVEREGREVDRRVRESVQRSAGVST
jgi:hypothetical protein